MRYESDYYAFNPYNPYTTLQQHGVMGQKWGVWNEETRARYLGPNRRKSKASSDVLLKDYKKQKEDRKEVEKRATEEKPLKSEKNVKNPNQNVKTLRISSDDFSDSYETQVRPATKKDLNYIGVQDLIKAFNIDPNDLVVAIKPKNSWMPEIYRKDGKPFRFQTKFSDGTVYTQDWANLFEYAYTADYETHLSKMALINSDSSDSRYFAVDPYDPQTTAKQHGVMGQKWGVWNAETRARYMGGGSKSKWFSKITDRFKKTEEEPHLKRTHLTKELSDISDEELNAAIKRMQLEKTYLEMLKNYPTASDRGQKYANQFTDELFKNLTTGLGGAMGKKIAKAIDDWINDESKNDKKYYDEANNRSTDAMKKYNETQKVKEAYINYRKKEDERK